MSARHTIARTDLGDLLLVADGEDLTGVYFPGHWYPPSAGAIGDQVEESSDPVLAEAASQLREYLAGDRREFDLRIATAGDDFSEQVWALLREIPYGTTTTYGSLAEALGNPRLAQRVGHAVGHNPISIVIPCHRVLGADGSLTGFAGGLDRKRALLTLEEPAQVRAGRLF